VRLATGVGWDARVIDLPDVVRTKAVAVGAPGWLDALPGLVADLERDWSIAVGAVFPDGTEALVAAAVVTDGPDRGADVVLKVGIPRSGDDLAPLRHEIAVLRLADGEGCVRLLRADPGRGAMLLERLGPSLFDLAPPLAERLEVLCSVAERFWRPAPGLDLPTGAEKARRLAATIPSAWAELDRPCSERAVEHALACAERRAAAHDDARAVLVHGDLHQWNVLRAADRWALVDPDGLLAEPEYDLGIVMREDPEDMLDGDPYARAHRLAARTGKDPVAIWEWGVVERVSTGLLAERIGLQPVGRLMLAVADRFAGLPGPR
jgi:streptomycin 6-kinase